MRSQVHSRPPAPDFRAAPVRWPALPVAPHEPEELDELGTLEPAPAREAGPHEGSEGGLDERHVLIGLVMGFGASMVFGVALLGVSLAAFAAMSFLPSEAPPVAAIAEPTLQEVLGMDASGEPSLARVLRSSAPAPIVAEPPARKAAPKARTARAPSRAKAAPAKSEESVQMSLAELRSYLSGRNAPEPTAPAAAPPVPSPQAAPPSPAQQVASRALSNPTPATVGALAVAQPEPPKRPTSGRQVVMADGLPPLSPVRVQLDVTGEAAVLVDGQPVLPGALVVEAGAHEVRVRTARDEAVFHLTAGDGDAWCFQARGKVRVANCRR